MYYLFLFLPHLVKLFRSILTFVTLNSVIDNKNTETFSYFLVLGPPSSGSMASSLYRAPTAPRLCMQTVWISFLALSILSCVLLGKSLNLCDLSFLLTVGIIIACHHRKVESITWGMYKAFEECCHRVSIEYDTYYYLITWDLVISIASDFSFRSCLRFPTPYLSNLPPPSSLNTDSKWCQIRAQF
jgi:hypothetical protein